MPDPHYPTIDSSFIEEMLCNSGKIIPESRVQVGDTITYVTTQTKKPIYQRLVVISMVVPGEASFIQCTGLALNYKFLGQLLQWLEANRNWKDGGYKL